MRTVARMSESSVIVVGTATCVWLYVGHWDVLTHPAVSWVWGVLALMFALVSLILYDWDQPAAFWKLIRKMLDGFAIFASFMALLSGV